MKLGFVSAILAEQSLQEVFAFAESAAFECVEVMCWPPGKAERKYAGVTHFEVGRLNRAAVAEFLGKAEQFSMHVSALGYYPNVLDPNAAIARASVEHLKKVIVAAAKTGLGLVTTFAGRDWNLSLDENWPRFLKTWKPLLALAEDQGVRIAFENCPMLFTRDEWPGGKNLATSPAIWRRMFSDLGSKNLGLNYDPSHLVWQRMDWLAPLREFRDRIFHVHAKDVRLDQRALDRVGILAHPLEYHQPRIPGFGEIDWGRFIGTLMEIGYDGAVCIEVEDETFGKTLRGRQRALRIARQVLQPYFETAPASAKP